MKNNFLFSKPQKQKSVWVGLSDICLKQILFTKEFSP